MPSSFPRENEIFWYLSNMHLNRFFKKYVLNSTGLDMNFKYPKENTYIPVESKLCEKLF